MKACKVFARKIFRGRWALALIVAAGPSAFAQESLCPSIVIAENVRLKLSNIEKRMVCGDPGTEAWARIPPAQARFQMTSLLQERGFQNPSFVQKGATLFVYPGKPTVIKSIRTEGAPAELDVSRRRGIVGENLTPSRLTDLEKWIDMELRFHGYACPEVKSLANKNTGEVLVRIDSGPKQKILSVDVDDNLGLQEGVLRRYDAFQPGEYFNARDLELTERRIIGDNVVASTHFLSECKSQGVLVHQNVNGGPPRTLTFAFGVNTEQLLLLRTQWRHSRLDNKASEADITAQGGFRTQDVTLGTKWYYSGAPREYLRPSASYHREKEAQIESDAFILSAHSGVTWDETEHGWLAEFGPTWRLDRTVVGIGPSAARSLLLEGRLQVISHNFEYYSSDPRTGYQVILDGSTSNRALTSAVSAQELVITAEQLWNYQNYLPPLAVFGVRFGAGTTFSDTSVEDPALPRPFRQFLGGNRNLRGFSREELPKNGLGALTFTFASLEARFNSMFSHDFQPFIFTDAGALGTASGSLAWPLYWSPGLGLRWASPIGVIRANGAYGMVYSPNDDVDYGIQHWQFYLSFGEEF